ncbi:guanine nucleotide-binding protein subunit beta-like protein 1 [Mytilus californianus]|uniref:guanine nucleotide-binding protein subunit beta-like protein 1 n=1 Tax=Mytilus californianus TaxID=6549 RepID=UPI002245DCC8|nr:guanine nucleotide-binding protein subunit beta-like protein 1 [Mytilus californianus]
MAHGPDPVYILRGCESAVTCLKYWSNNVLYSGDQSGNIYIWDMETKRPVNKTIGHFGHSVLWIEFINDCLMVTQGRDGNVQFWNKTDDAWTKSDVIKSTSFGYCACSIVDNKIAIPTDSTSTIQLYDMGTMQCIGELKPDVSEQKYGMCMTVKSVESKILIGYENGCIASWDAKTLKMADKAQIHKESVMCLDYSSQSNFGISGSPDESLKSWSISENSTIIKRKEITAKNPGFTSISIRHDQKIFASGGWDSNVRIYSVKKLKPLAVLSYHKESVQCVTFSSDNILACGSKDHHISLWDIYR